MCYSAYCSCTDCWGATPRELSYRTNWRRRRQNVWSHNIWLYGLFATKNTLIVLFLDLIKVSFCHESFCQELFCQESFCQESFCQESFCQESFCQESFCQESFCQESFCKEYFAKKTFCWVSFCCILFCWLLLYRLLRCHSKGTELQNQLKEEKAKWYLIIRFNSYKNTLIVLILSLSPSPSRHHSAKSHFAKSHSDECHSADCCCAEWHSAEWICRCYCWVSFCWVLCRLPWCSSDGTELQNQLTEKNAKRLITWYLIIWFIFYTKHLKRSFLFSPRQGFKTDTRAQ